MRMSHVWLHNTKTDGYWEAPEGLVKQLVATGEWERCEQPVEYSHATAEHAAWREEQAAVAAGEGNEPEESPADEAEPAKPSRARRSASTEE